MKRIGVLGLLMACSSGAEEIITLDSPARLAVPEGEVEVTTLMAQGPPFIRFELSGGVDRASFRLDGEGRLRFENPPDFERPSDADRDGVYETEVFAVSPSTSRRFPLEIEVTNRNEAPAVDGPTSFSLREGPPSEVGILAALDPDGDPVTFRRIGARDGSRFTLDSKTGILRSTQTLRIDPPGDENGDNLYRFAVLISDGILETSAQVEVQLLPDRNAFAFTSSGMAHTFENDTGVFYTAETNASAEETVDFSLLGGPDAAWFALDETTGALRFRAAPDFEFPQDLNANNRYELILGAQNGDGQTASLPLTAVVENRVELAQSATITFPTPGALLGAVEETWVVGTVDPAASSFSNRGIHVTVNGAAAAFDNPDSSLWRVRIPVEPGPQHLDVRIEGGGENLHLRRDVLNDVFFTVPFKVYAGRERIWLLCRSQGLMSFDRQTGLGRPEWGPSSPSWSITDPASFALSEDEQTAYISDGIDPKLVALNLSTGQVRLLTDRLGFPVSLELTPSGHLLVLDLLSQAIYQIDRSTGDRTTLTSRTVGSGPDLEDAIGMVVHPTDALAYVNSRTVVYTVDLESGDRTVISSGEVGTGPRLRTATDLEVDSNTGMLWVSDASLDAVVQVDPGTGDRSLFSGSGVGTGPALVDPNTVHYDGETGLLWVTDVLQDALFVIDPINGARAAFGNARPRALGLRSSLTGVTRLPGSARLVLPSVRRLVVHDLSSSETSEWTETVSGPLPDDTERFRSPAVDPEGSHLFLPLDTRILSVDLNSRERQWVTSPQTGAGPVLESAFSVAWSAERHRLWVADLMAKAIVSVDPQTGVRVPVSGRIRGAGPPFQSPFDVEAHPSGASLFVADQGANAVFQVDVDTGDRSVLAGSETGSGVPLRDPRGVAWTSGGLLVAGAIPPTLVSIDVHTGARTLVTGSDRGSGPLGLWSDLTADPGRGVAILQTGSALYAVDLASGQRVYAFGL